MKNWDSPLYLWRGTVNKLVEHLSARSNKENGEPREMCTLIQTIFRLSPRRVFPHLLYLKLDSDLPSLSWIPGSKAEGFLELPLFLQETWTANPSHTVGSIKPWLIFNQDIRYLLLVWNLLWTHSGKTALRSPFLSDLAANPGDSTGTFFVRNCIIIISGGKKS